MDCITCADLTAHILSRHIAEREKKWKRCEYNGCGYKTEKDLYLERHVEEKHGGKRKREESREGKAKRPRPVERNQTMT